MYMDQNVAIIGTLTLHANISTAPETTSQQSLNITSNSNSILQQSKFFYEDSV